MSTTTSLKEIIHFVYPDLENGKASCHKSAILTLRNRVVDELNTGICDKLQGDYVDLISHDHSLQNEQSTG